MNVQVADRGSPPKQAATQATVTVNVRRNENNPIFFNQTYYRTLLETVPLGDEVVTVQASDSDSVVSYFFHLTF